AAEVLDAEAQFRQGVAMLQRARGLLRGQFHRFRNQKLLGFQSARAKAALELLEQNALVQGVLVDDEHALRRFEHEVGVVKLNRFEQWRLGQKRRLGVVGGRKGGSRWWRQWLETRLREPAIGY